MKSKKAEISTSMIVGIVIVVITFGIIAIVFSQLYTTVDMDRQTCSTAATSRGTLPEGAFLSQSKDFISIKCKTEKICVSTSKKGDCRDVFGSKYTTYQIKKKEGVEEQIKMLLAREMAGCWNMLGKGYYPIFAREFTTDKSLGAVSIICSRVHFDRTITDELRIKEINGFNYYLLSHKVPNYEISYWDFLRNTYQGETMTILSGDSVKQKEQEINDFLGGSLDISQTKSIFFVEVNPTAAGAMIGGAGGAVVGVITSIYSGAGAMIGGGIIAGTAALGTQIGDWIQISLLRDKGIFSSETKYASGIFLTDYSLQGFKSVQNKDMSFEIASST